MNELTWGYYDITDIYIYICVIWIYIIILCKWLGYYDITAIYHIKLYLVVSNLVSKSPNQSELGDKPNHNQDIKGIYHGRQWDVYPLVICYIAVEKYHSWCESM